MKSAACLILYAVAATFLAGPDSDTRPDPKGMSLRLELFVNDLEKSAEFYTKVLGFERATSQPDYIPVRSGNVVLGLGRARDLSGRHYFNPELQKSRRGLGTEIVLEVDDIKSLFEKVKASGHPILAGLRRQSWGATDFRIADPDGYYLRITSR